MFKMSIGQYLPGNSPVHRMDPRVKLVVTFLIIIGVLDVYKRQPPCCASQIWDLPYLL